MSAATGVDLGAPNLNLSLEEKRIYGQLFRQADGEGIGVVTGEVAVKFFEKTRLDSRILGEIWQIADKENRGLLTPAGFGVVLRLIGHAQAGREPTPDLALQQGPIPRFEGLWPPQSPSQPPLQPQSSGGAIRIPPLTPDKVAQYSSLFERQNLQGGFLPGEQARSIFDKSGLPNETLGRIWGLADTDQRGALALPEFIIAMHLLTSTKTGALRALPNVLPPGLYEAASRTPAAAAAPRQSPSSTGIPAAIPRQLSGSAAQQRNGSPLGRPPMITQAAAAAPAAPAPPPGPSNEWAIIPTDKARFDQIFETFDKSGRGFITGEEAVPFLSGSHLPEDTLAQIWDLADFDSQGRLSRDGFAVAMYLIRQQRNSRGTPLPSTLPLALIPPNRRDQTQAQARPATAVSSTIDPPPVVSPAAPTQKSALEDLFGLDSSSPSSVMAPTQTTMSTGGSNVNDPFGNGSNALRPSSPLAKSSSSPTVSSFKPFVPSSSFGRGLSGQALGEPAHRPASEDLLSDTDHDASKKISEDATELANLSIQIGSLAKQTQEVQSKKVTTQTELNQTNSQKQNFEQRLAQLRQLYEKEAQDTHSLEERLRQSRADTQKLRGECMTLEGQLRDIQTQHQQVSGALHADQQENSNLRERIRAVNGEIAQLKPLIERLKMEARQQKGLVVINKKQLSTTEGERDKLKSEADSLSRSVDDISRQADNGSPASVPAQMASPTPSTSSGNNPFFKRTASADILGVFASQPARPYDKSSFDDLFGPAGPSSSTGTPPPVGAFGPQHTGQSSVSVGSYSNISTSSPHVSRAALSAEAPASSDLRQLVSGNLPLAEHNESLSSSRHVSPPTSRAEGSGAGSFPFPGTTDAGKGPTAANEDAAETKDSLNATTPIPAAQSGQGSHVARGSTGSFDNNDVAKAKEDFDNAFAAFASAKSPVLAAADASKPLAVFDTEFPPISELERDDSDSASEGRGFDDDFAPASPEGKFKEHKAPADPSAPEPRNVPTELAEMSTVSTPPKEPTLESKSPNLPSSPATITQNNVSTSRGSAVDDIFGSGTLSAPSQHTPQNKGAFDELDDDFEGLEDAKEGSADDDFANISRSGLDDYNPMFDSSPPASQGKSESTAFGNESTFDFISSNSAASGPSAPGGQQKGAEPHDWDAIFAGLDSPGTATPPAAGNVAGVIKDDGAGERPPAPGRALTEGGEHDDPILKSLTGMGYSRAAAVEALEKFDYNLEKAANHLASQS